MKPTTYRENPPARDDVVLYLGSANSRRNGRTKHLAREGDKTTLCGHVNLSYNQKGEINGNKKSPYRGPDRVLGSLCSICQREIQE